MIRTILTVCAAALLASCASHNAAVPLEYAVVQNGTIIARDNSVSLQKMNGLRHELGSDFVWFERNGSEYVATNPEVVDRAKRAIAPAHELMLRGYVDYNDHFVSAPNGDPFASGSMFSQPEPIDPSPSRNFYQRRDAALAADRDLKAVFEEALKSGQATPITTREKS